MGIRDFIQGLRNHNSKNLITWKVDPSEGVDFILDMEVLAAPEHHAISDPHFGVQLTYLKGLLEQSLALRNANGFTIPSQIITDLGEDFVSLFELPEFFSGQYQIKIEGNTGQAGFTVRLELTLADGSSVNHYELYGPFLKLAENELYSLTPNEWRAVKAINDHQKLPAAQRGEYENNWLLFQLQNARKAGMNIDLAHFNNLDLVSPESIGVAMEELPNGDLQLTPAYGAGLDLEDIKARLGNIRSNDQHHILRVKNTFVLLDEKRLQATREILTNRTIPKNQVANFLKAPTAYLDAALIELDTGFSLRVHGAERFTHRYFGDVEKSGVDWFSRAEKTLASPQGLRDVVESEDRLQEIEALIQDAQTAGADTIEYEGQGFDISDIEAVAQILEDIRQGIADGSIVPRHEHEPIAIEPTSSDPDPNTEQAVVAIDSNDDDVDFAQDVRVTGLDFNQQTFNHENLKRDPFPHQQEGIGWLLAHLNLIADSGESSGALLADDMGLGKTYMTLVAMAEWYRRCELAGVPSKPALIVAPLSLIENWQAEVAATFNQSPFRDIIVLQAGGDLKDFRIHGAGRETRQEFSEGERIEDQDKIRYSLKVGNLYGNERLDMPARLVLTTYQTLRDYQFSLSRIDWSIAAFDEAQNLKNPNALATRAAKGLKADFKLLATGTPVENSLKDFWCLMDTAVPGLLGAWQTFRQDYIVPITSADADQVNEIKITIGRELRTRVGDYMLRRTKAEKLTGLPSKQVYSGDQSANTDEFLPELAAMMSGRQLAHYDEIVERVKHSTTEDKRGLVLPSLRRLKVSSIHQDIDHKASIPNNAKELIKQAQASAKIQSMIGLLQQIKKRNEKVLVFAETKAVQAYVCALVSTLFKIPVDTINGETKAVTSNTQSKRAASDTRKAILDRFQAAEGFGVIVMSPIAAGVGLTVTGANNVIHLERHWNPAKEAQATDRVYRIGQTRSVNVYLPMALHPERRSFDLHLNSLLANKVDLSDAVVAANIVEPDDLAGCF